MNLIKCISVNVRRLYSVGWHVGLKKIRSHPPFPRHPRFIPPFSRTSSFYSSPSAKNPLSDFRPPVFPFVNVGFCRKIACMPYYICITEDFSKIRSSPIFVRSSNKLKFLKIVFYFCKVKFLRRRTFFWRVKIIFEKSNW